MSLWLIPTGVCKRCDVGWDYRVTSVCWSCGKQGDRFNYQARTPDEGADLLLSRLLRRQT